MKELNTVSNNLIVVEVPEDAYDCKIHYLEDAYDDGYYTLLRCWEGNSIHAFELSPDEHINCVILGKLSELPEQDCEKFVDTPFKGKYYLDYNHDVDYIYELKTAKESLVSLLQFNGIDVTKNLILIEKL